MARSFRDKNTQSAEKIFFEEDFLGWTAESKLAICLAFIDKQQLHPQFRHHVHKQAKMEQEFTASSGV